MSRKSILNLTSIKKKDTMLSYTNVTAAAPFGGTVFGIGAATLTGATSAYEFLHIPTARDMFVNNTSTIGPTAMNSLRTSSTCFIRGVAEKIHIQSSTSQPWVWRRIVFYNKGPGFINAAPAGAIPYTELVPQGFVRTVTNWNQTSSLRDQLFRGKQGVDWTDIFMAPIDTSNFTPAYDKTFTITSCNDAGFNKVYSRWHPVNKNLVYDDDENGIGEDTARISTPGKPGVGDMYIYDILRAEAAATTSDVLLFEPNAVVYWHEK